MYLFAILRCLLLGFAAVLGDRLVLLYQNEEATKALFDNLTHAVIGVITWVNLQYHLPKAANLSYKVLCQSLLCGLIASAIDVDHFIAARSLHLKDATNLSRRPLLHCTTLPLAVWSFCLLIAYHWNSGKMETSGWIVLAAFLSHHIRDAARRGFWMWPFGSTAPIGPKLYVLFVVLLPAILSTGMIHTNVSKRSPSPLFETLSIV